MDTKQQQTNTFTGGLNMDLNPITTPNNILTDCINGTIITQDGNEYLLQNDFGNVKIDGAQLTPGYVPVGMKEKNGIIYIISYILNLIPFVYLIIHVIRKQRLAHFHQYKKFKITK